MGKLNVLVIQRILPPYRVPLFQRMASSSYFTLTTAYGNAPVESALESVPQPEGLRVARLHNRYVGGSDHVVYQRGVFSLLRSGQYEVVIAEFNPRILSLVAACFYARRKAVKWIWWGQGIGPSATALSVRLRLCLAQASDALIFYDEEQRSRFVSFGVPNEKTFVAPNSVETEVIDPLVQQRPRSERHRVLYIGRLTVRKKVDLLIRGFARTVSQLPPATQLTIIGDGPERERLQHLVTELGLEERVEFIGAVYQQERLAPWFNTAWVSVSPGAIGLSAIHSLAYGVPLIVARGEGHGPEFNAIEAEKTGLFFSSNDVEGLNQHLLTLAAAESTKWGTMSLSARQTIRERFSLASMVQSFEQAIQYVRSF